VAKEEVIFLRLCKLSFSHVLRATNRGYMNENINLKKKKKNT